MQVITASDNDIAGVPIDEIRANILSMPSIVDARFTSKVQWYIEGYAYKYKYKTEEIFGRSVMYFPIIERYLADHGLPDDIKYLAIVESSLNPTAASGAGAVGLWQFMHGTGKEMGLEINSVVDERRNVEKATLAAIEYLQSLYDSFGDWSLALAAYNSGPGRVRKAIRRAGSTDFWKIQPYLPKETRNYIPAFIAINYVSKFRQRHEIKPTPPDLDMQFVRTINVYKHVDFNELAQWANLPLDMVHWLNPSFKKNYIPKSVSGYPLTLPSRTMSMLEGYLLSPDAPKPEFNALMPVRISMSDRFENPYYNKIQYVVKEGDDIFKLAKKIGCNYQSIVVWNSMSSVFVNPGFVLYLYVPNTMDVSSWLNNASINESKIISPLSFRLFDNIESRRKEEFPVVEIKKDIPASLSTKVHFGRGKSRKASQLYKQYF